MGCFRTAYGYTHSENGWRMVNRECCVVANPVPFSNTAPVRAGDAATILNAWLIWYHHNVEPITSPVWGWSATNDVANSNHLSGTGLDVNAPKYPWGYRTMPADVKARVRKGLALFEGTIFWGADWSRADEMHYQLGFPEGDARIANFAARLNNGHLGIYGPPPVTPPVVPPANQIDREAEVAREWIGARKFDGERPTLDGQGRYVDYENGSVYWHPNANVVNGVAQAVAIPRNVYETWAAGKWEQGTLGYPVARHVVLPDRGDVQDFQGGTITRKYGEEGHVVHGAIRDRWLALGGAAGELGFPHTEEYLEPDGDTAQVFDGGTLAWQKDGVTRS
jgi:hypothetical protein